MIAARIGAHVVRHQRRILADRLAQQRSIHRQQQAHERLERSACRHQPEEPAFFHHQRDAAAVRLEQLARGPGHLLHQALEVGAGEQRSGQVPQPLQLAVPAIGLRQGALERLLLRFGQLSDVTKGDQREQCGDRGQQQPDLVVLAEQPEAEPGDDDRDADDGAGVGQPPPPALRSGPRAGGRSRGRGRSGVFLGDDLVELGLAGSEHAAEIGTAEAALPAAPGLPDDIGQTPAVLAGGAEQLREWSGLADTAGDQHRAPSGQQSLRTSESLRGSNATEAIRSRDPRDCFGGCTASQ